MERILIISFIILSFTSQGQVILKDNSVDFGLLRRADEVFKDFAIINGSKDEVVIFRVETPKYVDVQFSSKIISPGNTAYIRLKYNPPAEGPFKEKYKIYTSAWQKPKEISVKGESTYAADRFMPCPDFSQEPAGSARPFAITARDMKNIPIGEASVKVYREGQTVGTYVTDENGELDINLPIGRYFFSVQGFDTTLHVNATNDHLVAFLDYEEVTKSVTPEEPATSKKVEGEMIPPPPREELDSELPLNKFKPNNLVFLVDVSTSMKHRGKLELMKVAMVELINDLREIDRFTLISYASDAGVLVKTENNLDKEACKRAIAELTAGGKTEGAKALNRAGRAALDFYIENGNNQIILATDGAFNEGSEKAKRLSSKYRRKGVLTSVVGIKCGKFTTEEMSELAEKGGGSFVALNSVDQADDILLKEVKLRSSK